ncbi:hypothetical protein EJ04DRAFT_526617 [Polyplosphaeria fusca]|uniref:Uncharacterized protein n=1 Tax=Polyplosphaeria fusca TaxID=682080 RepID=A0A9P4QTT5_9PLEO|nr:hypothetical protein EJ04DRAFT_526617 [Polyplosphaeria fusca]
MDPVPAFSLAGTILQFIDSGSKFTNLVLEIYQSASNSSKATEDIKLLTNGFLNNLEVFEGPDAEFDQQTGLTRLASDCRTVAKDLVSHLAKLSNPGRRRKRDALKQALQELWSESEIDGLKRRLDMFQGQFTIHLLTTLR